MALEIERKFLVKDDSWRADCPRGTPMRQGYLSITPPVVVRVRVTKDTAILNIKKAGDSLLIREEFEYPIPLEDGEAMLASLCDERVVEKTRYCISFSGLLWEVDEFHSRNTGLVVAEVELEEAGQPVELPPWIGGEVSEDPRYLNFSLALHPWPEWKEA